MEHSGRAVLPVQTAGDPVLPSQTAKARGVRLGVPPGDLWSQAAPALDVETVHDLAMTEHAEHSRARVAGISAFRFTLMLVHVIHPPRRYVSQSVNCVTAPPRASQAEICHVRMEVTAPVMARLDQRRDQSVTGIPETFEAVCPGR